MIRTTATRIFFILFLCTGSGLSLSAQAGRDPVRAPVSPEEIARLQRQIARESRSTVEVLTEYRPETGEVNDRLNLWRYGGRLNLRFEGGWRFSASVVQTYYRSQAPDFNSLGTNVTFGLQAPPSDSWDARVEAGFTAFTSDAFTVHGLAHVTRRLSERRTLYVTAARSNIEETLLSAAGLRPALGPFAGELVGAVMENRFTGGLLYQLPYEADVFGEGGIGNRHGRNVESNVLTHARAGAGINLVSGTVGAPVTLARASYQFHYFGFGDDRSGFGGASLVGRRGALASPETLGGDGISPIPTETRAGVGGYFSPGYFVSNLGLIELQGVIDESVVYRLAGFVGVQAYTGPDPGQVNGVSGSIEFPLSEDWSLPISYYRDTLGPFTQQSILVAARRAF